MRDRRTFADAFNYLLYNGRQMIHPEALHPLDTTATGIPFGTNDGTDAPVQKFRDELKYLTLMKDASAVYLLLGIENQSDVNYAMPVKDMVYDALQYAAQVEQTARAHREAQKNTKRSEVCTSAESAQKTKKAKKDRIASGEYLTGFYKDDRLIPVITLVVFFSAEPWDGPRCIHDMLSVSDPSVLSFVPDYRINLIAPGEMSDAELDKFTTNLREVLLFIKHSKDKDRLHALVSGDLRFQSVDRIAARVISTVTGSELTFSDEGEEESDVCKALEDMRNEALALGRAEGKAEGRAEGRAEGKAEGRAEGRAEGKTAGKAESILEVLDCKPDMIPESLRVSILAETDNDTLTKYLRIAAMSSSVEEFSRQIA